MKVKIAWCKNYNRLTNFPLLNLSNSIDFHSTWAGCENLVEFPLLNLSNGEDFRFAWM